MGYEQEMKRARTQVNVWVERERVLYADKKWNDSTHDPLIDDLKENPHQNTDGPRQYLDWIDDYINRAKMFGLDSLQGRQALGKAIVTLHHMLESAVVAFGDMPLAGFPSGEIH
jgi:hypothetical protein